jgi:phosphoserine phosphatase
MDKIIVLIASPPALGFEAALKSAFASIQGKSFRWLARGEACEFIPADTADCEARLRALFRDSAVDIAAVPLTDRRKRLLVADMDSTMIAQECIDELAALAGVGDRVSAITLRAMGGEIDFETALRERLSLLAGLSVEHLDPLLAATRFTQGGRTLVQTMKAHGAYTILVSGGFSPFTSHVAGVLGFDEHRANDLILENGKLTGRAREPILGRDAKLTALRDVRDKLDVPKSLTMAVGDGANDLDMITEAGLGVAYRAKPILRERAHAHIDHGDLTALLYLQGYSKDEFVS